MVSLTGSGSGTQIGPSASRCRSGKAVSPIKNWLEIDCAEIGICAERQLIKTWEYPLNFWPVGYVNILQRCDGLFQV